MTGLDEDPVWKALEPLRGSAVVRDARAYADRLAETRARRRAFWSSLFAPPRLAATAAAAALVAAIVWQMPEGQLVETGVGEMRTATLADGSTVTLNTDTELRIAYAEGERRVTLLSGEARFDVARDPARPFRVTAAGVTVTALGTAFGVTALPTRTAVTLIEGKVVVEAAPEGAPAARTILAPGEQVAVVDGRLAPKRVARLDAALAWQRSLVDLNDLTVREALAEVNRYSETKVVVADETLAGERVSGVFRTGDVEAVAAALEAYFGLKVIRRSSDEIVLGRS